MIRKLQGVVKGCVVQYEGLRYVVMAQCAGGSVQTVRLCDGKIVQMGPLTEVEYLNDQYDIPADPAPQSQGRIETGPDLHNPGMARVVPGVDGGRFLVEIACAVCGRMHGVTEDTREAAYETAKLIESMPAPRCLSCIRGGADA